MDAKLVSKYGEPRSARYFVKSLEDLIDVIETVYKHVSQQSDTNDLSNLLLEIDCFAVPIPRTLSSHIIGFAIPDSILDSENRTTAIPIRLSDSKPPADALPKIAYSPTKTLIVKDVRCLYDIVIFQRFFKSLMAQNSDGIKTFTTKRIAEIRTESLPDGRGFQLIISFPGTLFKGQETTIRY